MLQNRTMPSFWYNKNMEMHTFLLLEHMLVAWLLSCNNLGPLVCKKHLFGNHSSNCLLCSSSIGKQIHPAHSGIEVCLLTKVSCYTYQGQIQKLEHCNSFLRSQSISLTSAVYEEEEKIKVDEQRNCNNCSVFSRLLTYVLLLSVSGAAAHPRSSAAWQGKLQHALEWLIAMPASSAAASQGKAWQ